MIYATRLGPFEPSATARDNQELAAAAPALTRAVRRQELRTPSGDALFGTDTSGLAQSYILYSGREVLPIGGFLGNVSASALATLQADISCGYMRVFVLAVSPPGPDSRERWIESHCTRQPPSHSRIVPRPVGENLRVPGRISPMRAALHRRQAAGVSKAHRGDRPCTSTAAGHGNRDHHVRARARSGQHHGASRRAAAPRSVGRSSERGWRAGVKVDDQRGVRRVRQATGWGQEEYAGSVAEDLRPRTWGISGRGACRARLPGEED